MTYQSRVSRYNYTTTMLSVGSFSLDNPSEKKPSYKYFIYKLRTFFPSSGDELVRKCGLLTFNSVYHSNQLFKRTKQCSKQFWILSRGNSKRGKDLPATCSVHSIRREKKLIEISDGRRCFCKLYCDICHSCLIMWYVRDATGLDERRAQIICIIIAKLLTLFELQLGREPISLSRTLR